MSSINCPKCNHEIDLINLEKGPFSIDHFIDSMPEDDQEYYRNTFLKITHRLESLKIKGRLISLSRGPVVDIFELNLKNIINIKKYKSLSDDLSLALDGLPIRIDFKSISRNTIAIEIPRLIRHYIFLDEILSSEDFINSENELPIVMGKDVVGEPFIGDLVSMPHMLIAGSTGSGKSMFLHTILLSLLQKSSHNKLKLVLIDPKRLELDIYSNVPNLLMPVISEYIETKNALQWIYEEMLRRITYMHEQGGQDLEWQNYPRIVIMIDELADLILSKEGDGFESLISELLVRGAQVGIHLIMTTQRPSLDVITEKMTLSGLARISFKVNYLKDSKVIIENEGADKLLGKGDMIVNHGSKLTRIHSAFVTNEDIETFLNNNFKEKINFDAKILEYLERDNEVGKFLNSKDVDIDPTYEKALEFARNFLEDLPEYLERKLDIGPNRARYLFDTIKENGDL